MTSCRSSASTRTGAAATWRRATTTPPSRELDAAIELAELIGSDNFGALAYSNRGDTYRRLGRLDDALDDLRRAEAIWQRLGSGLVHYAVGLLGDVQALRGQRSEAIALYRQAIELADAQRDTQALVPGLDRAGAHAGRRRSGRGDGGRRAGDRHGPLDVDVRTPTSPPAGSSCAAATRRPRPRGRRRGLQFGQAHQDRSAVAEALLLQASVSDPPDRALAEESRRLARDLGDRIGEARAALAVARSLDPPARRGRDRRRRAPARRRRRLGRARRGPRVAAATGGRARHRRGRSAGSASAAPASPVEIGEWGSRKARDLFKLLVARRGAPVVREEVAALLWPDEPDRSARRLSVLLSTIRGVLDPAKAMPPDHYVAADHDTVWLVREHVEIDVELFLRDAAEGRRLLVAGDVAAGEQALARAAARYLGDFCADDPYADWAAGTRELARHTFVELAGELARLADGRTEHGDAVRHRLRILDVDPYDEDAHLDHDPLAHRAAPPRRGPPRLPHVLHAAGRAGARAGAVPLTRARRGRRPAEAQGDDDRQRADGEGDDVRQGDGEVRAGEAVGEPQQEADVEDQEVRHRHVAARAGLAHPADLQQRRQAHGDAPHGRRHGEARISVMGASLLVEGALDRTDRAPQVLGEGRKHGRRPLYEWRASTAAGDLRRRPNAT